MTKPIAERISDWSRTEIIYRCRKCNTSFATFGTHEKYCHNCGEQQDWRVAGSLKEPLACDYYEEEKKVIALINKQNKEGRYE